MSDLEVRVDPNQVALRPGESVDVTVSVDPDDHDGRISFPVKGHSDNGVGILRVATSQAVAFLDPKTEPRDLPVTVEKLVEGPSSATFRITAAEPKALGWLAKRRLKRD